MIIKALHSKGILDLSSQNTHKEHNSSNEDSSHFALSLRPGQSVEIENKYRRIKNIDLAYKAGLIDIISLSDDETSTVLQSQTGGGGTGGTIGDPGSCDYDDGLLEMDEDSKIGEAICEINKVLASLAPSPAPDLDNIDSLTSGANGALSFGTTSSIPTYSNVIGVGDLPARGVDGAFSNSIFGDDARSGIIFTGQSFSANLNGDVTADGANYPANAFGNGYSGILEVSFNGSALLTADLTSTIGAITVSTPNGSTLSLSAVSYGTSTTGEPFDLYAHRIGNFTIAENDMINGWNYIQTNHMVTPGTPTSYIFSNYIDFVKDSDSTLMTASSPILDTLNLTGLKALTGIKYYTGGTALYDVDINNGYKNAYDSNSDAISFNGTNVSALDTAFDAILTGDKDKIMNVTDVTATITALQLLDESISISVNASHPRTADNLSNGGVASISNILLDNISPTSTDTYDSFDDESYRLEPGDYLAQGDVTNVANAFSSNTDRSAGGHAFVFNDQLVGHPTLINNGDFSTITNGPASNVDYSAIPATDLTYYRKVPSNGGVGSLTGFQISIDGVGTLVTSAPTSNTEIFFEAKNPGKTGWMNFQPFNFSYNDGDGMLAGAFDSSLASNNEITFGPNFFDEGESVVFRFTVSKDFTGNIETININLT